MEFSKQEYWNGLPFPSPGDIPDPGIKPGSPAWQTDSLPTEAPRNIILHMSLGTETLDRSVNWGKSFKVSTSSTPTPSSLQIISSQGHFRCRKSSANLSNLFSKRKCGLCLLSGIRCNCDSLTALFMKTWNQRILLFCLFCWSQKIWHEN